ncbi:MAG TPA: DUF6249 domain-containing protein [Thermoanaerobaculia bacterium]|nr:DUF6249 domain-containing protein [Thermoanaerobaculia bacterium]
MQEEFFWSIFGACFVFLWALIIIGQQRFRSRRDLKERELLHAERLAALEKGVEVPAYTPAPAVDWAGSALPRLALAVGLLLVFTGAGILVGFYFAPEDGFRSMWTVGFIPALAGVGLSLYSLLHRFLR